jgi:sigma-E factor negative regulatory protein RseC
MLETRARIIQIEGDKALIQASPGYGCEQCNGKGCGSSKLSQLFCSSPRQFQVENSINAQAGDDVIIGVAEGVVLRGISLVYLLPLMLLLVGALIGSMWVNTPAQHDAYTAIGALLGLVVGFFMAKKISLRQTKGYFQPYLVRRHRNGL